MDEANEPRRSLFLMPGIRWHASERGYSLSFGKKRGKRLRVPLPGPSVLSKLTHLPSFKRRSLTQRAP